MHFDVDIFYNSIRTLNDDITLGVNTLLNELVNIADIMRHSKLR